MWSLKIIFFYRLTAKWIMSERFYFLEKKNWDVTFDDAEQLNVSIQI